MRYVTFRKMEETISSDHKGIFTVISLASALGIFINLAYASSPYLGIILSTIYLTINSTFIGNILFKDESPGFRFIFGFFVMIMLIAIGGSVTIVATAVVPIRFDATVTIGILVLLGAGISFSNNRKIMTKLRRKREKLRAYSGSPRDPTQ